MSLKVSIVTVCYNSSETILDTILSVKNQDYLDIEYIVIDGGSTDNSVDIISDHGDVIDIFVSEGDHGIYDAMNKGVNSASGDIIGILNSDDVFASFNIISAVVDKFCEHTDTDMLFGHVDIVKFSDLGAVVRSYNSSHFSTWKLRFGWMPPHPATFVRKEIYLKVGGYDTSFKISADFEFFVRALHRGKVRYVKLDRVLVKMRTGGISTSGLRSSILLNNEIVKACRKNGIYTNLLMVLTKIPFKLKELI